MTESDRLRLLLRLFGWINRDMNNWWFLVQSAFRLSAIIVLSSPVRWWTVSCSWAPRRSQYEVPTLHFVQSIEHGRTTAQKDLPSLRRIKHTLHSIQDWAAALLCSVHCLLMASFLCGKTMHTLSLRFLALNNGLWRSLEIMSRGNDLTKGSGSKVMGFWMLVIFGMSDKRMDSLTSIGVSHVTEPVSWSSP